MSMKILISIILLKLICIEFLIGQEMILAEQKDSKGIYYGYGLMQFRFKELFFILPDEIITGHSGSIGSYMYYNQSYDLYIIGSFNQSNYEKKHIVFIIKLTLDL